MGYSTQSLTSLHEDGCKVPPLKVAVPQLSVQSRVNLTSATHRDGHERTIDTCRRRGNAYPLLQRVQIPWGKRGMDVQKPLYLFCLYRFDRCCNVRNLPTLRWFFQRGILHYCRV